MSVRLPLLVITMMLASFAVPLAYASAHEDADDDAPSDREARLEALRAARNASIQMFQEERADAIADYLAAFNATKASFLENKTRVLAACNAANGDDDEDDSETEDEDDNETEDEDENETEDENESEEDDLQESTQAKEDDDGSCVRDGLKPLIEKARAEHREQKDEVLARLLAARQAAREAFREARDAYGPHGSG